MSDSLSLSAARASLPDLLDRVQAGEEITITRHGRPVAVVVRPDALRARRAGPSQAAGDEVAALLRAAAKQRLHRPSVAPERAEELVAEVNKSRRRR